MKLNGAQQLQKLEIYSIYNQNPEFIRLQHKSITKHVLEKNYEFIVVNNARSPGLRQLIDSIRKREMNFSQCIVKLIQTKKRSREISGICSELALKSIKVKEDNSIDAKSRFPSRIVAYTLNWVFKNAIRPEEKKVVCLIDSDMFFIADVSINSLLEGNDLGLIPQYRGHEICYVWTGFAVFNFEKLEHPEKLNFSLGNVNGERCDVGGYTHHYLKEFQPKSLEYEFINLVDFRSNDAGFEVETYISGNIGLNLLLNRELSILDIDIQGDATQVGKILGASESQIRKNYQSAIGKAIEYCSDLDVNPRNIDLIHKKHENEVNFIVLHYKNASNPRDFQDKRYSEIKYKWCLDKLNNTAVSEALS
jgi:hypothetical protein